MQGRLLPKFQGLYQSFPGKNWDQEFKFIKDFKINFIELILDENQYSINPITNKDGVKKLNLFKKKNNISCESVCVDLFMKYPLHSYDESIIKKSSKILIWLIDISQLLNIKNIIIPCVDESSLKNEKEKICLVKNLSKILKYADTKKVNICLETDLNPEEFKKLILMFDSSSLKVNYDTGNSASLGYKIDEEFDAYGEYIKDVHINLKIN